MRILLDECLPSRLRQYLPDHEIVTVPKAGWAGIKNGQLLRLIAESRRFDVFLTVDKNLPQQQNISGLPFAVVVLRGKSNNLDGVSPFAPEILRRLNEFLPGHVYVLSLPD
jgi:predicted nuclease of predicted toxin-antitoxin system